MITYRISTKNTQKPNPLLTGAISEDDPNYKELIFNRALIQNKRYLPGVKVRLKGLPGTGEVLEVVTDKNQALWKGKSPYFIVVKYEGEVFYANPRQLKVVKK